MMPSRRLLGFLIPPIVLLVIFPSETMTMATVAYDLALLLLAIVDVLISVKPLQLIVERRTPKHLSLGAQNKAGWEVINKSNQDLRFEISDDVPLELIRSLDVVPGTLLSQSRDIVHYTIRPTKRGLFAVGNINLRFWTRLGLVVRQRTIAIESPVKVYPNVANIAKYQLAAQRHRLAQLGLTAARMRGQGTSFESLREYTPGDDLGSIDWKSTARHGRMITRNYESDRSQNILVVMDCGRLMVPTVDRLSRLDYAINATLLLTYVAMKQGDYIGLLAFSDQIETYVPPIRGVGALPKMTDALYRLEAKPRESNYDEACKYLALRYRKRSLIILLTDVVDKKASASLLGHAARFARRHKTVCITLRNPELEHISTRQPETLQDCHAQAVALQMLERRSKALLQMRQTGVDVIDVDPRSLTPSLVNRYLQLKRR